MPDKSLTLPGIPNDVRIVRACLVTVDSKRPRLIGRNAVLGDHGDHTRDHILRLYTNSGVSAWGTGPRLKADAVRRILGKPFADLVQPGEGFADDCRGMDIALWDLLGKVTAEPVWKLLGGEGNPRVPCYDGSIYFADLLHPERGAGQVVDELTSSMAKGHRAFKLKIGRGHKWMTPWKGGFERDVEVVRAARKAVGKECRIMLDANNGYVDDDGYASVERVIALLDAVGGEDVTFLEEMFPESVLAYEELQTAIQARGLATVLADGENFSEFDQAKPFLARPVLQILQPDIRGWGLTRLSRLAGMCRGPGIKCGPHNWGSLIGNYAVSQLGRAVPNFAYAEIDTAANSLFVTDGYELRDGHFSVPDRPGLGLGIDEKVFERDYSGRVEWDLTAAG